jgi:CHAT domain-containing protein
VAWGPFVTKAQALRHAQLELIEQLYGHPRYWSPFLLTVNL